MKVNFAVDKTTDSKKGTGPILFRSWTSLAKLCLSDVGINVVKTEAKHIDVNEKGVYIVFGDKRERTPDNCPYCNGQRGWKNLDRRIASCFFCGKETVS